MSSLPSTKGSLYWEQERQKEKSFFDSIGLPAKALMKARVPVAIGRSNRIQGVDADSAEKCGAHFDLLRALREELIRVLMGWHALKVGHVEGIQNQQLRHELYVAIVDRLQKGYLPHFESHRGKEVEEFLSVNEPYRYGNLLSPGIETLFSHVGLPESHPRLRQPCRYSILMARDGTVWVALILVRNGKLAEILDYHIACGPLHEDVPVIAPKISRDNEHNDTAPPTEFDVPIRPHDGT